MSNLQEQLKERIRKNYSYLTDELMVPLYVNVLFQEYVISEDEKEYLSEKCSRRELAERFLQILMRKPGSSIQKFFDIVRFHTDKQPQIYERLFPTSEQYQAPAERSSLAAASAASNTEWEEQVIPHFPALLDTLRPSLLLHHLRAQHLLTSAEYNQLQEESLTERERSERLLNTILPCKERAVEKFCQVLLAVEGQKHIVSKILKLSGSRQQVGVEQSNGSLPGHVSVTASSSEVQMEGDGSLQVSSNLHGNQAVSRKRQERTSVEDAAVNTHSAMFIFRPAHFSWIQRVKTFLCNMCYQCFGIAEENVLLTPAESTEIKELVERCSKQPIYVDSNSVLAALFIKGIKPEHIRHVHVEQLEMVILRYLSSYDPDLEESDCKVLEIIHLNSSLIIFQLSINAFAYLLCALGESLVLSSLKEAVRVIFPRATRVDVRLGGLPPFHFFNDEEGNAQHFEQKSSLHKVQRSSSKLPKIPYEAYQPNKRMRATCAELWNSSANLRKQVTRYSDIMDSLGNTLKSTKEQLGLVRVSKLKDTNIQIRKTLDMYGSALSSVNPFIMSLCEVSEQTAGMWQYVRETCEGKLKGEWTRCQQLQEGVAVQKAVLTKKMLHEKSDHLENVKGDEDTINGQDRRTIASIMQLRREKQELAEKNRILEKEKVKNNSLMKELKGDRLLRIAYEIKAGKAKREIKWKLLPKLPEGGCYWNCVATTQNKVIVADWQENQFYIMDLHSSNPTFVIKYNTSGSKPYSLFNAGDDCFGTFKNEEGKQSIAKYIDSRNQWQHVTDIPSWDQLQRYSITANGDHMYIMGGQDNAENKNNTILVYDINTGQQCGTEMMKSKRAICSSVTVDNLLYVGGGWDGQGNILNSVECIPLVGDCSYSRVADTPTYGCQLSSLCGQLVMAGGRVNIHFSSPVSNRVSVLSPSLNTWLPLPTMNQPRYSHGTCTVGDDTVMVVGGWNETDGYLDSVELLTL